MKKSSGVIFFILLTHLVAFSGNSSPVHNGVLDLRQHNWQKNGIVNITGNWEFYWRKFYSPNDFKDSAFPANRQFAFVPDFWNKYITSNTFSDKGFGYATYHVKILCPSSPEPLALKFLTVQGAYRLFVNGKQIKEEGKADTSAQTSRPKLEPQIIKVQPENGVLDIVVQVSNFSEHEGGLWDLVKIGTERQIRTNTIKNLAIDFIVIGVFVLAFINNIVQFLYFRKRYAFLFFAILCLIIFARILVTGEIPINYLFKINWEHIRRLEYISFYFSVPVMSLFSYYLFPKDFSKKALYLVLPIGILFIAVSFLFSYYQYTYIVRYYQVYMVLTALYGLYVFIKAARKKRPGSRLFLIGFIIFLAAIINDVLYVNLLVDTVPLFYAGLVVFVFKLSFVLTRQSAQTFVDLEKVNKQLGMMNNEIQEKNVQLEKLNQELDLFVHRTSHDLRAPLSSVTGVTYLMENETNIATLHDYTALQKKTLQRMDELIEDIIAISKNKTLNLTLEEINFSELVNNTIEDLSHVKNVEHIQIDSSINQTEKFVSDKRRIVTILNNLISNAIKYSDLIKPSPTINIKITVVNAQAYIEVSDNGIGIDENKIGKIFTMFYRATSNASGSGLGLYITKDTVEKINGNISLHSKKGEGTTVKVTLPDKSDQSQELNTEIKQDEPIKE